jgi:hypothetical protein
MKRKLTLLTGAAIGYVFGTAAGRQRFEQIKAQAKRAVNALRHHDDEPKP